MALGVHLDLAEAGQLDHALQPVGVGQQADLDEHALQGQMLGLAGDPVGMVEAVDLASGAGDLGDLGALDDGDVGQAMQLVLQHRVGPQHIQEFQQGDVSDDAGQVDGRFHPRVATAHHRHVLALEQGAIAVGTIGDALAPVFLLAGHVQFPPAGAGGQNQSLALEHRAIGQAHLMVGTRLAWNQGLDLLEVHEVNGVFLDVFFQGPAQLGTVGVGHGNQVFDGQGIHDLTAKALR